MRAVLALRVSTRGCNVLRWGMDEGIRLFRRELAPPSVPLSSLPLRPGPHILASHMFQPVSRRFQLARCQPPSLQTSSLGTCAHGMSSAATQVLCASSSLCLRGHYRGPPRWSGRRGAPDGCQRHPRPACINMSSHTRNVVALVIFPQTTLAARVCEGRPFLARRFVVAAAPKAAKKSGRRQLCKWRKDEAKVRGGHRTRSRRGGPMSAIISLRPRRRTRRSPPRLRSGGVADRWGGAAFREEAHERRLRIFNEGSVDELRALASWMSLRSRSVAGTLWDFM